MRSTLASELCFVQVTDPVTNIGLYSRLVTFFAQHLRFALRLLCDTESALSQLGQVKPHGRIPHLVLARFFHLQMFAAATALPVQHFLQ